MLLFYIRHGEPVYDPDSLTPLGRRQAEAVAKRLARYGIDEIYASSSTRAQQTAQPASELVHKPVRTLDWCNEAHAWEQLTIVQPNGSRCWLYQDDKARALLASGEVAALGEKWYTHPSLSDPRFAEGMERVGRETYALIKAWGYEFDAKKGLYRAVAPNEKRIALFAHEGFGMAFLSTLLHIPYSLFCTRFGLEHSSMSVVRFGEGEEVIPCLLQLSNDSHLYAEGLPTRYNGEIYF